MNELLHSFSGGSTSWLAAMLPVFVKSILILGVAGIVNYTLRNSAAALRHLVWLAAVVGVLATPILETVVPRIGVPVGSGIAAGAGERVAPALPEARPIAVGEAMALQTSRTAGTSVDPASPERAAAVAEAREGGAIGAGAPLAASESVRPRGMAAVLANLGRIHWSTWLIVAWAAGVALLLARLLIAHVSAFLLVRGSTIVADDDWNLRLEKHALRLGVARPVRLRETEWIDIPVTVGSVRPFVVLPAEAADWDPSTRDAVLLHELAHIKRLDCMSQTLVEFVRALLWINPLIWFVEKEMRVERERACDDLVITSGTRASTYADTLLSLARSIRGRDRTSAAVMAMARRSDLEGRLLDILDTRPRLRHVNRVGAFVALFVVCSIVLPVAALTPVAQSEGAPSDEIEAAGAGVAVIPPVPTVSPVPQVVIPDVVFEADDAGSVNLRQTLERLSDRLQRLGVFDDQEDFVDELMEDVEGAWSDIEVEFSQYEYVNGSASDTLTIDQIINLARHGVDAEYIDRLRAAGYSDLSYDALIGFARHGVDADYIGELSAAGLATLPADDLIAFARHGVDAEMVVSLRGGGFDGLTAEDILQVARHCSEESVAAFAASGLADRSAETMSSLCRYGVDPDDIAGYASLGLSDLNAEDLISMARYGLDPDDIARYADVGLDGLTVEDYTALSRYGVDEELLAALMEAGYVDLPIDSIIDLARHGVDGDLINALARLGYGDLTVDDIVDFARYGLDAECIEELNSAGYGKLAPETLIQFSKYGVTADFISELAEAGITDLSVDELVRLAKHGISADYIKKLRNER